MLVGGGFVEVVQGVELLGGGWGWVLDPGGVGDDEG